MSQRRLSVLCAAALLLPATALACLWDADTLQMERTRFPTALELITGKFLRHTPEFYYWRIDDRLRKLKYEPDNLAYYDDLAVAYEKTGQRAKAIETIQNKSRLKPGVYETESNLGTFLMLDGKLEEGLKHIDAALRINPDAHFGREKYQKKLAEYMILFRKDGKTGLPLYASEVGLPFSFAEYLAGATSETPNLLRTRSDDAERQAAIKAVLGMMRFANYDSPVLLEVLGHLLEAGHPGANPSRDAKQLATRAYLKASYAMSDAKARKTYRERARSALFGQLKYHTGREELPLEEVEMALKDELTQADEWFTEVRNNELTWIKEGKDPEQEFARVYYDEPRVETDSREELPPLPGYESPETRIAKILGLGLALAISVVALKVFLDWKARRVRAAKGGPTRPVPPNPEGIVRP